MGFLKEAWPSIDPLLVSASWSFGILVAILIAQAILRKVRFGAFGRIVNAVKATDEFIVRYLSKLFGAHVRTAPARWSSLIAIQFALCAAGAFAPFSVAVPGLAISLLGVIAYYRRWAWDEADRERDLLPHERRIPIAEDLTDELAVNLAFLIFSSSVLIFRLEHGNAFFGATTADASSPVRYVLLEILQAIPLIGNIEVLDLQLSSGLDVLQPLGGFATFGLRAVFDIIVIGGVISLFSLARAALTGADLSRLIDTMERDPAKAMFALAARAGDGVAKADQVLERFALAPQSETQLPFQTRMLAAAAIADLGKRQIVGGVGRMQVASAALNNLAAEIFDGDRPSWRAIVEMRADLQVDLAERLSGLAAIDARNLGLELMQKLEIEVAESLQLGAKEDGDAAVAQSEQGDLPEQYPPAVCNASNISAPAAANLKYKLVHVHYSFGTKPRARRDDLTEVIDNIDANLENDDLTAGERATLLFNKGGLLWKKGHMVKGMAARNYYGQAGVAMEEAKDYAEQAEDYELMLRSTIGSCHAMTLLVAHLPQDQAISMLYSAREQLSAVIRMSTPTNPALASEASEEVMRVEEMLRNLGGHTNAQARIAELEAEVQLLTSTQHFGRWVSLQLAIAAAHIELSENSATRLETALHARSAIDTLSDTIEKFSSDDDPTDRGVLLNNLCRAQWVLGGAVEDATEQIALYLDSILSGDKAVALHEEAGLIDMAMGSMLNRSAAKMLLGTSTNHKDRSSVLAASITESRKVADYYRDSGQIVNRISAESNWAKAMLGHHCDTNSLNGLRQLVDAIESVLQELPDEFRANGARQLEHTRDGAAFVIESVTNRPFE